MKTHIFILALLITVNGMAQERKVKFALGLQDNFVYTMVNLHEYYDAYTNSPRISTGFSPRSYPLYNLTSLGLGINIRVKNGNISLYGMYSLKGYIAVYDKSIKSYEFHNHLLGIAIEYNLFHETKKFRPYVHCLLQTEICPSYKDRYIDKEGLFPFNSNAYPVLGLISSGQPPIVYSYGSKFYQNTPIMFGISAGYSMRIFNGFQLNASFGYNLTRWNLKYVRWMNATELAEKLPKAPILHYSLHSMAFQLGLSYAFSFHKKDKQTNE